MKDRYDKAIEYLTEHPGEISDAWGSPNLHPAGCLFMYAQKKISTWIDERSDGKICGCLSMIRRVDDEYVAWTDRLTAEIKEDDRIPSEEKDISLPHLPVFAEWQRRLDKELGRIWPDEVKP